MTDTEHITYAATYRRSERVMPGLVLILVFFFAGLYACIRYIGSAHTEIAIISLLIIVLTLLFALFANTFRVHRWTITQEGLAIDERPRVPFTGRARRAIIPYSGIAALRRIESGFDHLIEVAATDGTTYRLPQALPSRRRLSIPPRSPDFDRFAETIRCTAGEAGHALPDIGEGLSFWNTPAGLITLALIFALSLLLAGVVLWALWNGFSTRQPRGGEAMAIVLLLPFGAFYLLLRALRRRRAVLSRPPCTPTAAP
jgi:hypothetical protein